MYFTWLDSNSWLLEIGGWRILLDPWLVGDLTFNNVDWLFKSYRLQDRPIPNNIDLILLSQGLEDHAHPPTLKQLDRHIPVLGSPQAAKVVEKLGYYQVKTLHHGESFTLEDTFNSTLKDQLEIKALPGSPVGPNVRENGYVIRNISNNVGLYYEPHGYHSSALEELSPVDVVITPIINLSLPLLGPVIKGMNSALEVAKLLKPQIMLPTAAGGDVFFDGILSKVLQAKGNVAEFKELLELNSLSTQVIEPKPGERISV
ncbi:MBL fold metallo-hydrolase [Cylindrospermopsis raciborskii CHAB3438]|uniref:MBL fold metallo-hydrolase n=1 Tax=Cylindrospermopsis raciborskii TaxID=77022 RepID=UPI001F1055AB|nr:MBL fold metallo-hydrolase [Cylindrospermopsis raciborskii]MCH4904916.1 MBL fold metallo-hydrolase [Cylindrospermopsis raciborskii CHAB3438]MEB3145699.1 MBL fold metallo-hydrolase [Cylindrospermopsis raciborskii]